MLGCNQTITIYNRFFHKATKTTLWSKTVLRGASWAGCQRVTTGEGLTSNDGYSVRVMTSSFPPGYLLQSDYQALNSPDGYWTVQNGDVVMLGEGPDVRECITDVTKRFADCFTVIAVHTDNMSRRLPHIRIEGK